MIKKVYTSAAPEAIGPYSQAIVCGNLLFTSGQVPINPATGEVEAEGIEAQALQVMKNLGAVLAEAGTSFEKAVKTTCFLKNMEDFAAFNAVYAQYFTEKPATRTAAGMITMRRIAKRKKAVVGTEREAEDIWEGAVAMEAGREGRSAESAPIVREKFAFSL